MYREAASLPREEQSRGEDVALARKTIIFRDAEVPKGAIIVDAVNGVVTLRGEADRPERIGELQRKAGAIPGVARVENLLHLPGTPAPNAPSR